jgi:Methyltransferase domain
MALAELHPRATTGSSRTTLDRYPELFRAASQQMPDATRILSYGCSTGEECATLTRYFPAAEIVGTDINLWSLARARKHFSSERITFVYSGKSALSELPQFDVIFAMSVLRASNLRAPKHRPIGLYYPFNKLEEDIAFLDSMLKWGGLLVLAGTTYRFCDTSTAKRYQFIREYRLPKERRTFYPDGTSAGIYTEKLFRKKFVASAV